MDQQDTNQTPQAHKPEIPEDVLLIVPVPEPQGPGFR